MATKTKYEYVWKWKLETTKELKSATCDFEASPEWADRHYCSLRYLAKKGSPRYTGFCDLNQDGIIDATDLAELSSRIQIGQARPMCEPEWIVDIEEVKNKCEDQALMELEQFETKMREKGYDIKVTEKKVKAFLKSRDVVTRHAHLPLMFIRQKYVKIEVQCEVKFESENEIMSSPIDPITAGLIAYILKAVVLAVVLGVIAYFAIQALENWLKSMTTTSHTIIRRIWVYDEDGNLIGYTEEEEDVTEPSIIGIAEVGSIIVILVAILTLFLLLRGRK